MAEQDVSDRRIPDIVRYEFDAAEELEPNPQGIWCHWADANFVLLSLAKERDDYHQIDLEQDAVIVRLSEELDQAKKEIAEACEACPSVRQQANFDAPLLMLVNYEVGRGFMLDSAVEKLADELAQVKAENGTLQQVAEYLRKERADLAAVAESLKAENDVLELVIKDEREELRHHIDEIVKVKAENERLKEDTDELMELVRAVERSTREDENGEQWTIRAFLAQRNAYSGDISGSRRLVAESCRSVIRWIEQRTKAEATST